MHNDFIGDWFKKIQAERARHRKAMHTLNRALWRAFKEGNADQSDKRLSDWSPLDMLPFERASD